MRLMNKSGQRRRETDLTGLINIVFLILIFFIVAGALRPFSARDIELTKIAPDAGNSVAPAQLIAHADGRLTWRGSDVTLETLGEVVRSRPSGAEKDPIVVVADRRLEANVLLDITRHLKSAGFKTVAVMSERARKP